MARILIVDDEPAQLRHTAEATAKAGFQPMTAMSGRQALDMLRTDPAIRAVVLDVVMPETDGFAVLDAMRAEGIGVPVVAQVTQPAIETIETLSRLGATDFVVKPASPERLLMALRNALKLSALERLVQSADARANGTMGANELLGFGPGMERVATLATRAAKMAFPVLIEGEAGTGKERLARVIHGMSDRAGRPFVRLDCGGASEAELELMLFGERRGGPGVAQPDRPGKLMEAHGGTLLLSEIGELPGDLQGRIAKFIETGEYLPLGAERPVRANVRVITTTRRRLLNLAKAGLVREDLYYRLNVFPVYLPPLRDRGEDAALLARHVLARFAAETGRRVTGIAGDALALLSRQPWPGNVRELETAVYRAVALASGSEVAAEDFPQLLRADAGRDGLVRLMLRETASAPVHIDDPSLIKRESARSEATQDRFLAPTGEVAALADMERDLIVFALGHHNHRMSRVARALGIGRSTLYRKLREYGLDEGLESDAA
jgi:DNA-binding NtrC family response regulator